jgi:hypothetical protein
MGKRKNIKRKPEFDFYHEPKEAARAQLNSVKSMLYELDLDTEKNLLSKTVKQKKPLFKGRAPESVDKIKCNLAGALPYLFERTAYFCTHDTNYIDMTDPDYGRITVTWDYFCKGIKRKSKMQQELARLFGLSKNNDNTENDLSYKCIDLGNHYVFVQPFVITMHTKDKEELSRQALAQSQNIDQAPIDTITIRFFKPLFENYIKNKNNYLNLPTGWYDIIQDFIEENNLHTNPAGVLKTWQYLNLHDNSIGRQKLVNIYDMFLHVDPQAIRIRGNKIELRDNKARAFLFDTIALLQQVTQKYRHILNFTLDGITIPNIPGLPDFNDLPVPLKIKIILNAIDKNRGKIVLSITRNYKINPPQGLLFE